MNWFYWSVVALFPLSEILFSIRNRSRNIDGASRDRGSMKLIWISIAIGIGGAIAAEPVSFGKIEGGALLMALSLMCMIGGVILRRSAIHILGRFFTVDIAVFKDHTVCERGPYRLIRHPSYTGLIIYFLGLGLSFGNYLSIVALLVPILGALINRVIKEERVLVEALGEPWRAYCKRTKRFVPFLV